MNDLRKEYLARMQNCPQFGWWPGVAPIWVPGTGDIEGFCHDEVVRQGHNPLVGHDGGERIGGMMNAWTHAQDTNAVYGLPSVQDITVLAHYIEPHMNPVGMFRSTDVLIGGQRGAPPKLLRTLVSMLVGTLPVAPIQANPGPHADRYRETWVVREPYTLVLDICKELMAHVETADDWYLAFEAIHPFSDGNGRTGKVLHNWLMGTLDEPVLVQDYFGGGNP